MRRIYAVGAAAIMAALWAAGSARAAVTAVTVTDAAGRADPAARVSDVVTVTGSAPVDEYVWLTFRPAGGAPCAASYDDDSGTGLISYDEVDGAFAEKATVTAPAAGAYLFCAWLADSSDTVTKPFARSIAFRAPVESITAAFAPARPRPHRAFKVTVSGTSEAPTEAFAAMQRAGAPCAPTFASDPGGTLLSWQDVDGDFSLSASDGGEDAGAYVACLWLADSADDAAALAGPIGVPVTVASPPHACVVPRLRGSRRLRAVKRRIRAAHCTIGTIRHTPRTRLRRGLVVRLSPRSGRRLAHGAPVSIVVSRR
jgi:hypothetical protein